MYACLYPNFAYPSRELAGLRSDDAGDALTLVDRGMQLQPVTYLNQALLVEIICAATGRGCDNGLGVDRVFDLASRYPGYKVEFGPSAVSAEMLKVYVRAGNCAKGVEKVFAALEARGYQLELPGTANFVCDKWLFGVGEVAWARSA